jgi:hypothetical protein
MSASNRVLFAGMGFVERTMAGACLLFLLAILAAPAIVLGAAAEQTVEGSSASAQEPKAGPQAMPQGPGPHFGPGMMGRHHAEAMDPCCMMMGSHMAEGHMDPGMCNMGMMGMMGPMMGPMGAAKDPKAAGRMLQMRGEMLKAIGDIMMKHGKAMEEGH